jgi:hypothetical protein
MMGTTGLLAVLVLLFFTCWLLAAGCSRAHIRVSNHSGMTVSNLVISGSCKERRASAIPALSEWYTTTPYWGDGLLQISFDAAGKHYITNSDVGGNHSGFCAGSFTIGSNMIFTSAWRY